MKQALPKILLSEGSSLSARQTITALGLCGYPLGVCDPDPHCIGRFSRFVKHFYRCPSFNEHPLEYVQFIDRVARQDAYTVMIPVHEQAYLFARYRQHLQTAVVLSAFSSFQKVQGKIAFAQTLQNLSLPQPDYQIINNLSEIKGLTNFPFYLKTDYSTAGQGVWQVKNQTLRDSLFSQLAEQKGLDRQQFLIQQQANGELCQVQAIFNQGRLIAWHSTRTRGNSIGGGHAARMSVNHPVVGEHLKILGSHLGWNGPIALDYIYDSQINSPLYLEANPRLVEPMNAFLSGVNFPELAVKIALQNDSVPQSALQGKFGVRSHSLMAILLGQASQGYNRRALLKTVWEAVMKQSIFEDSEEDLTPIFKDAKSILPLLIVLAKLLLNPHQAAKISSHSINSYSLQAETIRQLEDPKQ